MTPEALLDLFVLSPVGLAEVGDDGRVEVANLAARSLLGPLSPTGTLENLWVTLAEVAPDLAMRARSFSAPRGVVVEHLEVLTAGDSRGVVVSLLRTTPERFVVIASDASDLAAARTAVTMFRQQLHAVENALQDHAVFTVSTDGQIASWSESALRLLQYTVDSATTSSLSVLFPGSDADGHVSEVLELASRNGWCVEEGQRRRMDGTLFHASTVVTALRDGHGETVGYSVVIRDLSDRMRLESALRDDASSATDYLTGVMSQRAFLDLAMLEVARARRYGQPLTIVLADPDNLADLSEAHGSAFVDEYFRAVASACRHQSRNTDFVGRVGGAAFAVLLPSTELSGGLVLAERIRERLHKHVFSGDLAAVRGSLSVGVAELGDENPSAEQLLTHAAAAVERAQASGRNLVVGYDA